jgi:hypothetical protein
MNGHLRSFGGWYARLRPVAPLPAAVMAAVVFLSLTGTGLAAAIAVHRHEVPGRHHAQAAPRQAWGSAAGKEHVVATGRNQVKPQTLRSKYPLRPLHAKPKPARNVAKVAAAPGKHVHGFDARTSRERADGRDAFQRVFDNADGTQTTEFSQRPLNYRRPDGSWAPIDTRLLPAGPVGTAGAGSVEAGWRNTADAVAVQFAPQADRSPLAWVGLDAGHQLAFGLEGAAAVAGQVHADTVSYPNAWPDADLRIQVLPGGGLKETIVLRSPDAAASYTFPLRLQGLSARLAGRQVVLTDVAGRQRAVIPAGSMQDASADPQTSRPATSDGVTYRLVGAGQEGTLALQVTLDTAWLKDPARTYPVLVDPSVDTSSASSSLVVTDSGSSSGAQTLQVGKGASGRSASYLAFSGSRAGWRSTPSSGRSCSW